MCTPLGSKRKTSHYFLICSSIHVQWNYYVLSHLKKQQKIQDEPIFRSEINILCNVVKLCLWTSIKAYNLFADLPNCLYKHALTKTADFVRILACTNWGCSSVSVGCLGEYLKENILKWRQTSCYFDILIYNQLHK